ncbi:MAG: DUF4443 domain-containing protein [Nitrososphaerales archaeon]
MLSHSSEADGFINRLMYKHKIKFPKIVTLFLLIKEEGPVGRYKIMKELELPEGVIRGVQSDLINMGIVHASKKGAILTDAGTNILSRIFEKTRIKNVKKFNFGFMALDSCCAVAQLYQRKNSNVLKLRDNAVRAGASACMVIFYERGRIIVPKVYKDLWILFPPLAEKLEEFSLADGDLLIVAFAPTEWKAKEAAIYAAINDNAYRTMALHY